MMDVGDFLFFLLVATKQTKIQWFLLEKYNIKKLMSLMKWMNLSIIFLAKSKFGG